MLGLKDDVLYLLDLCGRAGHTVALLVSAYLCKTPLGYLEMLGALAGGSVFRACCLFFGHRAGSFVAEELFGVAGSARSCGTRHCYQYRQRGGYVTRLLSIYSISSA